MSEQGMRKFIRFLLSIKEPPLRLHQTLTFSPPSRDELKTQKMFRELIDSFRHQPRFDSVGWLYFHDVSQKDGHHYHLSIYFFDKQDLPFYFSQIEDRMRALIFEKWDKKQGFVLVKRANKLIDRTGTPYTYLLKKLRPVRKERQVPHEKTRRWGYWNREIFRKNSRQPPRDELRALYRIHLRRRRAKPRPSKPRRKFYTRSNVEALREQVKVQCKDWQKWTQERTGLSGNISDEQLRESFNEKVDAGLTHKQITGFN